jgi:hypothetical protein
MGMAAVLAMAYSAPPMAKAVLGTVHMAAARHVCGCK